MVMVEMRILPATGITAPLWMHNAIRAYRIGSEEMRWLLDLT